MYEPWEYSAKWSQSQKDKHCDSMHMSYLGQSDSLRHKVDGGSQGWRGGENGVLLFSRYRVCSARWSYGGKWWWQWSNIMNVLNFTEMYTRKCLRNNSKWNNLQRINLQNTQAAPVAQYQKNKPPNQQEGENLNRHLPKTYRRLTNTKNARHRSLPEKGRSKLQWGITSHCQNGQHQKTYKR